VANAPVRLGEPGWIGHFTNGLGALTSLSASIELIATAEDVRGKNPDSKAESGLGIGRVGQM